MPEFWSAYLQLVNRLLGPLQRDHGSGDAAVADAETRLGFDLPLVLAEYYRRTGRHSTINQMHNRLIPLSKLALNHGRLVFYEENQRVVLWAVRQQDLPSADPPIYQGVAVEGQRAREWHLDNERLSGFLLETLCWQMVMGGLPIFGHGKIGSVGLDLLRSDWPLVVKNMAGGMEAYSRDGLVLCIFPEAGSDRTSVYMGGKTEGDLALLGPLQPDWQYMEQEDADETGDSR